MTPTLRLAHVPGAQGDNNLIGRKDMKQLLKDHEAPALLVSYVYIEAFLKIQEKYIYRDWMMDSGAYSAYNSGKEIDLHEYINACHLLKDSDPTLTEVIALDVIGSGEGSLRNAVKMKEAGVGYAMPVFHIGDDWEILKEYCKGWDKVGISCRFGESRKDSYKFYDQCFARTWPKKFHSFGWADEEVLMRYPLHCMTDEHTVLTQNGWKGRTEVKQGDYVLAFKDGTSMWEEVNCVYDYSVVDYPIIHMDNRVFSAQVTDHHRWRVHNTFKEAWEWTTTDRLNCHDRIAKCADYMDAPVRAKYDDYLVELIAWYWTEGYLKKRKEYKKPSITITQSEVANPGKTERIRELLAECGEKSCELRYKKDMPEYKNCGEMDTVTFELYGEYRDKILEILPTEEKILPLEFILALTKDQLEWFVNISVAGDGNLVARVKDQGLFSLGQKDGKNIEVFRIACILAGYSTTRTSSTSSGSSPCRMEYVHAISTKFITPRPRHVGDCVTVRRKRVYHTGYLWCINIPSGAFFTKCKEHVYVTGNSSDCTTWEVGPCAFGRWAYFGKVSIRGSNQNLRTQVLWYLDLEKKLQQKWKKEMEVLAALDAPTVRLVVGTGRTVKEVGLTALNGGKKNEDA